MRTTLRDVAERAGVSHVTASNVMRGKAGQASEETRQRVLDAMRALRYVPVAPPSRQRVHTPTRVIGLFYDGIQQLDQYWGLVVTRGLHAGAIEHDYDLMTVLRGHAQHKLESEEIRFLDRRSDGFIFLAPSGRAPILEALVQHDIPVVTAFTDEGVPEVASVVLDNADAMRQAVEYLTAQGHRQIAYVAGWQQRSDFRARREGFLRAMQERGNRAFCLEAEENQQWIEVILGKIREGEISAIVCVSDYQAIELWNAARAGNLRMPEDFSLIGMDDIPQCETLGLTSIGYSCAEVGRRAMEAIVCRLNGVPAAECSSTLPIQLRLRTSVAPVKNKSK